MAGHTGLHEAEQPTILYAAVEQGGSALDYRLSKTPAFIRLPMGARRIDDFADGLQRHSAVSVP